MSARKLTDADKVEILKLYRETEETTSTLAVRYDVSHSTISRFLKGTLSPAEYEVLIQQKRSGRTHKDIAASDTPVLELPLFEMVSEAISPLEEPPEITSPKLKRKRSAAISIPIREPIAATEVPRPTLDSSHSDTGSRRELLEESYGEEASAFKEMLGEDLSDLSEDMTDLEDDEDEDLDGSDLDDLEDEPLIKRRPIRAGALVQVLPLSEASLPRTCYLVVDRSAELVARPLRDFGDLGQIPQEEVQEKTLPVFDNHRVARRFSNRTQRVIKVPDGRMLQKVGEHLRAKGITRLLIDGQVYSLLMT